MTPPSHIFKLKRGPIRNEPEAKAEFQRETSLSAGPMRIGV